MITRADVINNTRRYINIQGWTPLQDTHVFNLANPDHTFHSAFRMVAGRQYDVVPYCYGGFDSRTRFSTRINNRVCPGGWDRISGNGTKHWYDPPPIRFGYAWRVSQNLAGIDCSGYVLRCWDFTSRRINGIYYNTNRLPNLCVEVDRRDLKKGDILNSRRLGHVMIFNELRGFQVDVYEARGGGRHREFRAGDEFGRVVHHTIDWARMNRYTPYSPFPQFAVIEPATCPVIRARPTFRIRIKGSGELKLREYIFDENCVLPRINNNPSRDTMDLIYTPNYDLTPLRKHSLFIKAINRMVGQSFEDEFSWEFVVKLT